MAHPQIATFARLADGSAQPIRKLEGQTTLLGRTMHAIAYDEVHDEFMVPQQFGQAILTFRGGASGEEAPIRVIQGSNTRLVAPDRLAVDPVNNEIYVPEGNVVLVYPREGNGNVAPIRAIEGPDTQLGAGAVAVDPVNNLLVVAGGGRDGPRFLIFNRTDQGNVKPKAIIGGPKSGFRRLGGPITVYPPKGWIIASDRGQGGLVSDVAYVGVWSIHDNGDVPPRWRIGGPNGVLQMPRGVTLDPKNKSLIVSDKRLNAVMTFYFPELF
ncbi:MAG: hypothetical protein V3T65_00170 [Acidobacteriota bacterium]